MKEKLYGWTMILFLFFLHPAMGQKPSNPNSGLDTAGEVEKRRNIVAQFLSDTTVDKARLPMQDVPEASDSITRAIQQDAWRAYFDYKHFGYTYRRSVFSWQLLSSKIIFFVVIVLVLSGIYFAGLQFFHAMRLSKKGADLQKLMASELTASAKEIKVSSPVLGVIILVLSFLFFFLYLKYVYPINETF